MLPRSSAPELSLLLVVEGENDVHFLTAMSAMLHRENLALPDLTQLLREQRIIFMPTGGSNLKEWMARVASLHKRAFYLVDREQEPETSRRRQLVAAAHHLPGSSAVMTGKRALENYLHPMAIREACGSELRFDDDMDVARLLARTLMTHSGVTAWQELPCNQQKRLHEKAKKILNRRAVQHMTPARLVQQDFHGEMIGWLQTIGRMADTNP
jgi:hypothetical protein